MNILNFLKKTKNKSDRTIIEDKADKAYDEAMNKTNKLIKTLEELDRIILVRRNGHA
jgi:hypothetical protein